MLSNMMAGALQAYIGKNGSSESLLQFGSKRTKTISASLVFENKRFTDIHEFSLMKAVNGCISYKFISKMEHAVSCTATAG